MNDLKLTPAHLDTYAAFASGQVLYSRPGFVAFPAKLAAEIFQTSIELLHDLGVPAPYAMYDPMCGSGQLLTTLALMFRDKLSAVIGSDVNPVAVALAQKNLGLLSESGLNNRIRELDDLVKRYGKVSHLESAGYARNFYEAMKQHEPAWAIVSKVFVLMQSICITLMLVWMVSV